MGQIPCAERGGMLRALAGQFFVGWFFLHGYLALPIKTPANESQANLSYYFFLMTW
jgi:hypothetical protein